MNCTSFLLVLRGSSSAGTLGILPAELESDSNRSPLTLSLQQAVLEGNPYGLSD